MKNSRGFSKKYVLNSPCLFFSGIVQLLSLEDPSSIIISLTVQLKFYGKTIHQQIKNFKNIATIFIRNQLCHSFQLSKGVLKFLNQIILPTFWHLLHGHDTGSMLITIRLKWSHSFGHQFNPLLTYLRPICNHPQQVDATLIWMMMFFSMWMFLGAS